MKILLSILIPVLCAGQAFTQRQVIKSETLSEKEVANTFSDAEKNELELIYPIFKVYKYSDESGQFYTILTGSGDSTGNHEGIVGTKIRAVTAKFENGRFKNMWEINDFADKKKEEKSIWIGTKYIEFKDYDNDHLADPVIVYGTTGLNGTDDGKIKVVIYYKGQKIFLRHQNSTLPAERQLQIDKAFYSLPVKLQTSIKDKMERMVKDKQAIFPHGWQTAMENGSTTVKGSY